MKQKGFTLVEMIAVIVVLAVIATIVVSSAYSIIEGNKQEQYETLVSEIKEAVRLYLDDNSENYILAREPKYMSFRILNDKMCSSIYIKLEDLVNANVIKEEILKDPRDNSNISVEKYVKVSYANSNLAVDSIFYDTPTLDCDDFTFENNQSDYTVNTDDNYISLNNMLFRIIKIKKDGSMRVISDGNIGSSVFGKDNSYQNSYVLASINYWYIYDVATINKNLIRESSLSLLAQNEYETLTSNVKGSDEFWLVTASNTGITNNNNVGNNTYPSYIRVVFEIKPTAIYVSGNGTINEPYTIR